MLRLIVIAASERTATQVSSEIYFHFRHQHAPDVDSAVGLNALARRIRETRPPYDLVLLDERLIETAETVHELRNVLAASPGTGLMIIAGDDMLAGACTLRHTSDRPSVPGAIYPRDLANLIELFAERHAIAGARNWLEVLIRVTELLQRAMSVQAIARQAVAGGCELGFERARFWLYNEHSRTFVLTYAEGNIGLDQRTGLVLPLEQSSHARRAFSSPLPIFYTGQAEGEGYLELQLAADGYRPPTGEWVLIPLWTSSEGCVGLLALDNANRARHIGDAQRDLLTLLGRQIAAAYERVRLNERERAKARELEVLHTIGLTVANETASGDLDKLLTVVHEQIGQIVDAHNCMIALLNESDGLLDYRLHVHNGRRSNRIMHPPEKTLAGHVLSRPPGDYLYLPSGCAAYRCQHGLPIRREPSHCYLAMPISVDNRTIGVLVLQSFTTANIYTAEHIRWLGLISNQIAASLQMAYHREIERERNHRLHTLQLASAALMPLAEGDEARFWHVVLTVATAGYGFGFNRATLFLTEEHGAIVRGVMGVGCRNAAEALAHWAADAQAGLEFEAYLERLHQSGPPVSPIDAMVRRMAPIRLDEADHSFARVVRDGTPALVPGAAAAALLPAPYLEAFGSTAYAVIPIRASTRTIGILVADNVFTCHPLRGGLLNQLESFLAQVALIRENVQQRHERDRLLQLTHTVLAQVEPASLQQSLSEIALVARETTGADSVLIYPFLPNRPYEVDTANIGRVGLREPLHARERFSPQGITRQVATLTAGSLVIADVAGYRDQYNQCLNEHPFLRREGVRAFIGTPIRYKDDSHPLGVLYFNYSVAHDFSAYEQERVQAFATLAAIAIRNAYAQKRVLDELIAAQAQNHSHRRARRLLHELFSAALDPEEYERRTAQALIEGAQDLLGLPDLSVSLLLRVNRFVEPNVEPNEVRHQYYLNNAKELIVDEERHWEHGITGRAFTTGQPQRTGDVRRAPWDKLFYCGIARETRSELDVPIVVGDRTIGVFNLESPHADAFDAAHEEVMVSLAASARLPLDSLRRRMDLRQERNLLRVAIDITRNVGTLLDLDAALEQIFPVLREWFPGAVPCLMLYNDATRCLEFAPPARAIYQIDHPTYRDHPPISIDGHGIASTLARDSLSEGRSMHVLERNVRLHPRYLALREETRAELCISLVHQQRLQGMLILESADAQIFSRELIDQARAVADQISLVIDRAHQSNTLRFTNQMATLTAGMAPFAHDLNRAIGAIRLRASCLRAEPQLSASGRASADEIDRILAELRLTVTELMPGAPDPEQTDVELDEWLYNRIPVLIRNYQYVQAIWDPNAAQAPDDAAMSDRRVQTLWDLNAPGQSARVNPGWLEKAIGHLLRNAVRALQNRAEPDAAPACILIRTRALNERLSLTIADNGPGVPAHLQAHLFQRPLPGEDGAGGLGLMTTRFLIERMGGAIRSHASCTPAHPALQPCGAVFTIMLPQTRHEPPNADGIRRADPPRQGDPVDDDHCSAAEPERSTTHLDR